jgi:hypothetical protein
LIYDEPRKKMLADVTRDRRRDVDVVEADFVAFKAAVPERIEFLVPTLTAASEFRPSPLCRSALSDDLLRQARSLAPWGYVFDLAAGVRTDRLDYSVVDAMHGNAGWYEMVVRTSILDLALRQFGPTHRWLDVATNCGVIPLLLNRDSKSDIVGIDISSTNIQKAKFLAKIADQPRHEFLTADVFEYLNECQDGYFDVISALGIFYHLSDPLGLARSTRSSNILRMQTILEKSMSFIQPIGDLLIRSIRSDSRKFVKSCPPRLFLQQTQEQYSRH